MDTALMALGLVAVVLALAAGLAAAGWAARGPALELLERERDQARERATALAEEIREQAENSAAAVERARLIERARLERDPEERARLVLNLFPPASSQPPSEAEA